MNSSKYKYIFLIFAIIYLIDGISMLIAQTPATYSFFGFPMTKNQELLKQFIIVMVLFFAYWKLRDK